MKARTKRPMARKKAKTARRPPVSLPEYLTERPYLTKGQSQQAQALRNAANQIFELEENNRVLREAFDRLPKPAGNEATRNILAAFLADLKTLIERYGFRLPEA